MRKTILLISLIAFLGIILNACERNEEENPTSGLVELYLLDSYTTVGNTLQIDENSAITKPLPLLRYSDFLYYDSVNFAFKVTDKGEKIIEKLNVSVHGLAFAITADHEVVYTGYFWPSFSSASCDWLVIDPIMVAMNNELAVKLGYPGAFQGVSIPDKRNDKRIVEIFKANHKLK